MRPDDMQVFAILRETLDFNSQRQRVLAQNIANANTPGYVAQDLDRADFHKALRDVMQTRRSGAGLDMGQGGSEGPSGALTSRTWSTVDAPDSEVTVNGNAVVIEEQMVKANETRMHYETALSLYQKSLGLMRLAIKPPAR